MPDVSHSTKVIEVRDQKRLLRFPKQIANYELLIAGEVGFVPLAKAGAELLSQRYERGSTMVTSNLPFQQWTEALGPERLTGALLDRFTPHVRILEMDGDSYHLKQSRHKCGSSTTPVRAAPRGEEAFPHGNTQQLHTHPLAYCRSATVAYSAPPLTLRCELIP